MSERLNHYQDLLVWQKAHNLTLEVYRLTRDFPKDETYGLTSQLRRAASSVPANIVEGNSKHSLKDRSRFFDMARGSLAETEYFLELSRDLGYATGNTNKIDSLLKQTAKLLWNLQKSLKS